MIKECSQVYMLIRTIEEVSKQLERKPAMAEAAYAALHDMAHAGPGQVHNGIDGMQIAIMAATVMYALNHVDEVLSGEAREQADAFIAETSPPLVEDMGIGGRMGSASTGDLTPEDIQAMLRGLGL